MRKLLFIDEVRPVVAKIVSGEISVSKFVELINEQADNNLLKCTTCGSSLKNTAEIITGKCTKCFTKSA